MPPRMLLADVRRVLCVAAHPDDEVLGAGATMAALADRGCDVHALVLGEGVGARFRDNRRPDQEVERLSGQVTDAARILGATSHQLALPDNRFDSLDMIDVVHAVEKFKNEIRPDVVLTHHSGDMNIDHRVTCNAVLTAFRPVAGERGVTVLAFETLSSTEWNPPPNGTPFVPNWFEDASPGLERKVEAMAVYREELREWPHPRSLEGIRVSARRWGMTVGLEAAEPFMLLRHVGGDPAAVPSARLGGADALELRPANPGDEPLLLGWRNDPDVRRFAFEQDEIAPDTHRAWFSEKLASADTTIAIVEEGGTAVGQVRLDRIANDQAEVDIAIAGAARGRGLGRRALRAALDSVPAEWREVRHVRAVVKAENEASLRAFAAAGFEEANRDDDVVELRYEIAV